MTSDHSIQFFDTQFSKPIAGNSCALNPFETAALPHFHGRVLDFGCGMGNLAAAAAKQGCDVVALDGSRSAIDHLQQRAAAEHLAIDARIEDLRDCPVTLADLPRVLRTYLHAYACRIYVIAFCASIGLR